MGGEGGQRGRQNQALWMMGVGSSEPLSACLGLPHTASRSPISPPLFSGVGGQRPALDSASLCSGMRHLTCDPQEILPTSEANLRRKTVSPEWTKGSEEASPPLPQPEISCL